MTRTAPISFLVPTFNGAPYLTMAIRSIADQLVDGDQVLVQDAASTDGSIAGLVATFPGATWLNIVSEPDRGQSDALGRALTRARNDYVMWLNADDIVYPNALGVVRAGITDSRPDILAGRSTVFNNSGRVIRTYTPGPITRRALLGHGSDLFTGSLALRTELVREAGGFNPKYQYCMDIDLLSRLAERDPRVTYVTEVIGGLRWHNASKGGSTLWPIVREATEIKLRSARTAPEKSWVLATSLSYLVAGLAQPIRHSRLYSCLLSGASRRHALPADDAE